MLNDKREGDYTEYFDNGQLKIKCQFKDNKKLTNYTIMNSSTLDLQ